jgi:hypothetical protein
MGAMKKRIMMRITIKCTAMLLMAIAVYLTIVYVNLDTLFFFLGSVAITCAVAIWVYICAFALLYVAYMGQFRKMTVTRVLNIVTLQSLIMFIWFTFTNLMQLYPYTVVDNSYNAYYLPLDFFPPIYSTRYVMVVSALLTVVCFITNRHYKRIKSTK